MLKPRLYFAFGMNTETGQMAARCPKARNLGAAHLPGAKMVFKGVADLVPHGNSFAPGTLWHITPDCEKALDRLEGFPHFYGKRENLAVIMANGKRVWAFAYCMTDGHEIAPPPHHYYSMLLRGYEAAGHGTETVVKAARDSIRSAGATTGSLLLPQNRQGRRRSA